MTAYGHAEFILASLESVLSQAVPPREVIVVNDGSPDDTEARLVPLIRADRIRYVSQPNAGMAAARNAGASLATSEYLYFLDDDDLLFPDALSTLVDELERYLPAGMACGDSVLFSGEPPRPPIVREGAHPVDRDRFLRFNPLGSPGQVLIRRSAFVAVGGFDARIWGTDDWDLWLRLLEQYPARRVHRSIVAYRLHDDNASRDIARMYRSSLRVARQHVRRMPAPRRTVVRSFTYKALRHYHVPRLNRVMWRAIRGGEWHSASAALRACIVAWVVDVAASLWLKAHLVTRGRWRLPPDEPMLRL